ncbi:MAG: DNA-3-methyladenine glycosylase I [Limisphaerales bacterium]|jgi:DNA-3-methyladenine glycosylase I
MSHFLFRWRENDDWGAEDGVRLGIGSPLRIRLKPRSPRPHYRSMKKRCEWCGDDPLYVAYHDEEWGFPLHDDQRLFEFLILEGAQAGLSWITILRKRENYRKAFDNFDPVKMSRWRPAKVEKLLGDPGIVRNRLKVESAISNARAFLKAQKEFGSFDKYIWGFVGGATIQNRWKKLGEIPATTPESEAMSKDLKRRGFRPPPRQDDRSSRTRM